MIGYVCFHPEGESCDLGYCFHSASHGKGYAFEACKALLHWKAAQGGVKTFTSGTAVENLPSCRLLKKLGFSMTQTNPVSFDQDEAGNAVFFEGGVFILPARDVESGEGNV